MNIFEHKNPKWPSWPQYGNEEKKAVTRVINSNQLFADVEVKTFEKHYAKYLGTKHCLGLGNATQALHLALAALNIGEGDEVLVTSYSWISTASCILMQNAVPVFCDIESESLGINPDDVESKINPLTKAVILTHVFGYPARIKKIKDICKKHNIALIEDSSHAHGADVEGQKVGTFGDISVFSLHQRKSLSVGDGGILCTDNDDVAEKVFKLRSFGHQELSYNYRMTEFAGALGQCGLKKLDEQNDCRIQNASFLAKELKGSSMVKVRTPMVGEKSVFYSVLLDVLDDSKSFQSKILSMQENGIPIQRTWTPLHFHPHFNNLHESRGLPWVRESYSGTMKNIKYQSLKLPTVEYYCPNRLLEIYVHPPCREEHLVEIISEFS